MRERFNILLQVQLDDDPADKGQDDQAGDLVAQPLREELLLGILGSVGVEGPHDQHVGHGPDW